MWWFQYVLNRLHRSTAFSGAQVLSAYEQAWTGKESWKSNMFLPWRQNWWQELFLTARSNQEKLNRNYSYVCYVEMTVKIANVNCGGIIRYILLTRFICHLILTLYAQFYYSRRLLHRVYPVSYEISSTWTELITDWIDTI
jgi:hypothetical protein